MANIQDDADGLDGLDELEALESLSIKTKPGRGQRPRHLRAITDTESESDIPSELQWLEDLPLESNLFDRLVDYPASGAADTGQVISTRIPLSWIASIEAIRGMPNTNLPKLWNTPGKFYRWMVHEGIRLAYQISKELNRGTDEDHSDVSGLSPMIQMRLMIERVGGDLAARSQTLKDAKSQVEEIRDGVEILMAMGESGEAANMVNRWVEAAMQVTDQYWRNNSIQILFIDDVLSASIVKLIESGEINDMVVIEAAIEQADLDPKYRQEHEQEIETE